MEKEEDGALFAPELLPQEQEQAFQQILRVLWRGTNTDFIGYKRTTLKRRIQRRMVLLQMNTFPPYLTYLSHHQSEVDALYQDLLIGVTRFFRDPATFEMLTQKVFPHLLATKAADAPLRVWVAVQSLQEPFPDLLFLDIRLSGANGQTICWHLKHQEATQHIPIILLSAHKETQRIAREAGAERFLAKPFEMEELLAVVAHYLGNEE